MRSIIDQTDLPNPWKGIYNPLSDPCVRQSAIEQGYRDMPPVEPAAPLYTRVSEPTAIEGDGENGAWEYHDRLTSELEEEERLRRQDDLVSTGLNIKAAQYRQLMNMYFGLGAETNREYNEDYVTNYFLTTPDLTTADVQRGMALQGLFQKLVAWNGTGEVWTIFEKYAGVIP